MNRSIFVGSALTVLLVFSVISYSKTFMQRQDPKPAEKQPAPLEVAGQVPEAAPAEVLAEAKPAILTSNGSASTASGPDTSGTPETSGTLAQPDFVVAPQAYTATAYSLRGRTASGRYVTRGLIAADPSILPLGSRVRVDAGPWSGEYLVADTGGAVKGRRIDIWTPSAREALQFGRRVVKLTVLEFGGARARSIRPRLVSAPADSTAQVPTQPEKKDN
jgi:3D (Asp-Asp-Asp) domain-containing protein